MKTEIIVGLMLIAMCLIGISITKEVSAVTLKVDSENGPYYTINSALDVAMDGYRIEVQGGPYTELIYVNKSVDIIGYNNPIIRPTQNNAKIFYIIPPANDVEINGFYLDNPYEYDNVIGVYSCAVSPENHQILINNIEIQDCYIGIKIIKYDSQSNYPQRNVVYSCNIHDNENNGIEIYSNPSPESGYYAALNAVKESIIEDNGANGIYCEGDYDYFRNNQIHGNYEIGISIEGDYNDIWFDDGVGTYNTITYNGRSGVRIEGDHNNLYGCGPADPGEDNIYIKHNGEGYSAQAEDYGVYLEGDYNWIQYIYFDENEKGGLLIWGPQGYCSLYNLIEDCIFSDNSNYPTVYDLKIYNSNYNDIDESSFENPLIIDGDSTVNDFTSCTISNSITIKDDSDHNSFSDCWIGIENNGIGIHIYDDSDDITLERCDFYGTSQSTAVKIEGGQNIYLFGDESSYSFIWFCDYAVNADCYGADNSSFYINYYDIDDNTIIEEMGYSSSYKTKGFWNNIPNEAHLDIDVDEDTAEWTYKDF